MIRNALAFIVVGYLGLVLLLAVCSKEQRAQEQAFAYTEEIRDLKDRVKALEGTLAQHLGRGSLPTLNLSGGGR